METTTISDETIRALKCYGKQGPGPVSGATLRDLITRKWIMLDGLAPDGVTLCLKLTDAGCAALAAVCS